MTQIPSLRYLSLVTLAQSDPLAFATLRKHIIDLPDDLTNMLIVRQSLCDAVLKQVHEHNGCIYGGYPRDIISGKQCHDMDIKIDEIYIENFTHNICIPFNGSAKILGNKIDLNFIGIPCFVGKCDYDIIHAFKIVCTTEPFTHIFVRIEVSMEHAAYTPDFDVNQLYMRKSGKIPKLIKIYSGEKVIYDFDVPEIFACIQQKQFRLVNYGYKNSSHCHTCSNISHTCVRKDSPRGIKLMERIKKMENRGWTLTNKKCENPWCILAPEGEFEKYCRKEKEVYDEFVKNMIEEERTQKEEEIAEQELELQKKYWVPETIFEKDTRKEKKQLRILFYSK